VSRVSPLQKISSFVAVTMFAAALATWAAGQAESDKAIAERILADLAPSADAGTPRVAPAAAGAVAAVGNADAGPAAGDAGASGTALTAEPVLAAKRALERANGARLTGDARQGELLEGLAREWAETARDLVRAAKAESEAAELETRAAQAGLRAERQRALLEEAIARRGRAEAELDKVWPDAGFANARPPASSPPGIHSKPPAPSRTPAPAPTPAPKGAR
jgi:hypothetical protein